MRQTQQTQYSEARDEHAFLLRAEGKTFSEIADKLGVDKSRARDLFTRFSRRLSKAVSAGTIRKKCKLRIIK